ncbi:MAG: DNA-formamidopyrimidine glycosylase family protein [Candidatus Limnocylindrales bacterium]
MPEGDTLARIAAVLGPILVGQTVTGARGRPGGARLEKVVGHKVESVEARGKHLLIAFDQGLTLHTHLALHGSWHRYRAGERWRRSPSRAVAVIETAAATAVCFDAPTVELIETRALAVHDRLTWLGPDLSDPNFDRAAALAGLRDPSRAQMSIGDALLDQRAAAGIGNVYRSELSFMERLDPFTPVSDVSDDVVARLLERASRLIIANSRGGARVTTDPSTPGDLYVYGRTGRPCRRCGTLVKSRVVRARPEANPRRVFWCPSCQAPRQEQRMRGST